MNRTDGPPDAEPEGLIVVTGLSGSGKSLAHGCLEDMGWTCVDNLPTALVPDISEMKRCGRPGLRRLVLTSDVREPSFAGSFPEVIARLREEHESVTVLFLEADDETLRRRFSETRRRHPLAGSRPLMECIASERERLQRVRSEADVILDTSARSARELRDLLWSRFGEAGDDDRLSVAVVSFGFRHGLPAEADLVFDARFLPNPHYIPELQPLSGREGPVREFLADREEYRRFLQHLQGLLDFLVPAYRREGKSYLTIAVGCTGGRHRSVAVTEELANRLQSSGVTATLTHRDCDRHLGGRA